MQSQDCYIKYTNDQTGAVVRSEHRVWDKNLFLTKRDTAARNHTNDDERGVVVEITREEFTANKGR